MWSPTQRLLTIASIPATNKRQGDAVMEHERVAITPNAAGKLHSTLIKCSQSRHSLELRWGSLLYQARYSTVEQCNRQILFYKYMEAKSWRDYAEEVTGCSHKTVNRIIRVWAVFGVIYGEAWKPKKYPHVGISKLRTLVRLYNTGLLTDKNVRSWLETSENSTFTLLEAKVAAAMGEGAVAGSTLTLKVTDKEKEQILQGLQVACGAYNTTSNGTALAALLDEILNTSKAEAA